eukprot:6185021-Pleurochrysis_carterae.AAC.3
MEERVPACASKQEAIDEKGKASFRRIHGLERDASSRRARSAVDAVKTRRVGQVVPSWDSASGPIPQQECSAGQS